MSPAQELSSTNDARRPKYCYNHSQELMNRHGEKERLTSVPILCRITLQNAPYTDYKLLVLMSFEVYCDYYGAPRARLL